MMAAMKEGIIRLFVNGCTYDKVTKQLKAGRIRIMRVMIQEWSANLASAPPPLKDLWVIARAQIPVSVYHTVGGSFNRRAKEYSKHNF
jgi:hypothetical protein